MKKAIIYDLDNTIYAVSSILDELFKPLLKLIKDSGDPDYNIDQIKLDIMSKPFQVVAALHNFDEKLNAASIDMIKNLTFEGEIKPFEDYHHIKKVPAERFLVTTGFKKLQYSKIRGMEIENDFKEIHIVDFTVSPKTKKDVFADIMKRYNYEAEDVLVVGDDPESEIKAAHQLGIDTIHYDKNGRHATHTSKHKISDFSELVALY